MLYTNEAINNRKSKEKSVKNKISILAYLFLIPLLIYNLVLIVEAIINPEETPSFLNIKTYVIISGSMEPELDIGDMVIVKKVAENELKIGDIISYRQGQAIITHRISQIETKNGQIEFKTKGDNNNTEDSGTIKIDMIEGKVIGRIKFIGKIIILLQDKITIILLIIIIYIYIAKNAELKRKKENRRNKRIEYEKNKSI